MVAISHCKQLCASPSSPIVHTLYLETFLTLYSMQWFKSKQQFSEKIEHPETKCLRILHWSGRQWGILKLLVLFSDYVSVLHGRVQPLCACSAVKGNTYYFHYRLAFCHKNCIGLTCRDGMSASHTVCVSVSQRELFGRKLKLFVTRLILVSE